MTETLQKNQNAISLKGSAKIVVEYLSKPFVPCTNFHIAHACFIYFVFSTDYGINSILFQRGIYPPETFKAVEQFGLSILVSTDEKIISFLDAVLKQIEGTGLVLQCSLNP